MPAPELTKSPSALHSLWNLFNQNAIHCGEQSALCFKDAGEFVSWSWSQLFEEVCGISLGLLALGVEPKDRIGLIANTRVEWVSADLATIGAGGITVPIFPDCVSDDVQYILDHSSCKLAFAEDPVQVAKLKAERHRLPSIERVVQLQGRVQPCDDDWVVSLSELKELGVGAEKSQLFHRTRKITPDSTYTLIYTSGTTGRPKAAVTTHKSMLYIGQSIEALGLVKSTDTQLLFLPLAHVFGRALMVSWLRTPHELAFAQSPLTLQDDLQSVKPTLLCGVPRSFEKIYAHTTKAIPKARPLQRSALTVALQLTHRQWKQTEANNFLPAKRSKMGPVRGFVHSTLGRKIRQDLGGRIRLLISGGAPLSTEIGSFFQSAGLELIQGYGLTESTAAACLARPGISPIGSVGVPLPGTEIRLAPDKEILIRGPGLMTGYWNDPKATDIAIQDGWLHTGDLGEIDDSGELSITGRKKEIIVTAGGKNISPQNVEKRFRAHPLLADVVVHGDSRKYLSAIMTLDQDALLALCRNIGFENEPYCVQTQLPGVRKHVERVVGEINQELSPTERIKAFKILEKRFSPLSGEVTPTRKIKREIVNQRYQQVFDGLYPESYF